MAQPIETISVPAGRGAFINASIWKNENERDGDRFTTYSVTIEKRYQTEGSWKSTTSYNANELLVVAHVAQQAYEAALRLRSQASAKT